MSSRQTYPSRKIVDLPFAQYSVLQASWFIMVVTSSPTFVLPEGILRPILAYGGSAFVCRRETAPDEIIKIPIRLDVTGCSLDVCEEAEAVEVFSKWRIAREKYIRSLLPHHNGILRYLGESGNGLRFPYLQKGHLRDYLHNHQHEIIDETRYN
jgi:hypothetical protein